MFYFFEDGLSHSNNDLLDTPFLTIFAFFKTDSSTCTEVPSALSNVLRLPPLFATWLLLPNPKKGKKAVPPNIGRNFLREIFLFSILQFKTILEMPQSGNVKAD
ncbi:MAG: hypothetical protein AUJ53_00460 [Flavobacteriaceae bacterium CG1_02_35_72]|nr:MAG: hypothetical protein AUJ53_00460 [Flavobacteriaceae bacterium CG1_02_35_72]PIR14225.1 MAG: hypothetical protein COV50_04010 [Flavobacteriales bacterium CG11_big_fil_rev_8_21_14_0_20_35_7]